MRRVVVLGPGGAGKSTFAVRLGEATGLPVIELDKLVWDPTLRPWTPDLPRQPPSNWITIQEQLVSRPTWILDGDLGPYDVLEPRLSAADTVVILDFSRWRTGWRALRRSRERLDFWWWVWTWRRTYRPRTMAAIASFAAGAEVHVARTPKELQLLAEKLSRPR